ncbi:MAG: hypothetical protein K0Q62_1352 [Phenylobacterium sp.]|jgi:hypothetical protein|nr:hypothetical protein [Phenylobacterium sp.]
MPQDPRHYTPTTQETNRAREQGAGMGQRDLDTQRDAGEIDEETRSFEPGPDPAFTGTPANVDPHDFEDGDSPQLEWGDPAPDAIYSSTHTRRPVKTEAERGQGLKTRQRNKQIVSGKPYG